MNTEHTHAYCKYPNTYVCTNTCENIHTYLHNTQVHMYVSKYVRM